MVKEFGEIANESFNPNIMKLINGKHSIFEDGRALSADLHKQSSPIIKPKHPGRNDLCPCGSGKKYKKCCMATR